MHNAKKNVFVVWCTKRTPFYTVSSNKGVFRFLVSVSLNRTMPSNVCFWCGTPNAQTMFSLSVFEVRSPKSFVFLVLCAERAFLCTKNANKGVFGYLVWVCLKCTMPKNVFLENVFLEWRNDCTYLYTRSATNIVFGYLVWVCLKCTMLQNVCFWCATLNAHTSSAEMPANLSLIPSMCGFEMHCAKKCVFLV